MKKLLVLALAGMIISAPAAYADEYEGAEKNHKAKMYEKMDTDGDGKITRDEFIKGHEARFGNMDRNNDGVLSKGELRTFAQQRREKIKERMENKESDTP